MFTGEGRVESFRADSCASGPAARARVRSRTDKANPLSQAGQATVEYILLLSFVVSLGVGLTRLMISGVDEGILVFGAVLEKDLQSGRMPPSAWTEE